MSYVVIAPARNEADRIEHTFRSVLAQTIRPAEWIVVNDGSRDQTGVIADEYAREFDWIRVIHRKDRGYRKSGGGIVDAFYDGYLSLETKQWSFVVKLDADLSFSSDYFEKCFAEFTWNPRLGIGGGRIFHMAKGRLELENGPAFHVRGATKIYRRQCWDQIGGLIHAPGWDTVDEVKARMLGWETMTFSHVQVLHHRFTGQDDGLWGAWIKAGRSDYICAYHPAFMLVKCLRRALQKPIVLGSFALAWGFLSGYLLRIPRIQDKGLVRYVRAQQIRKLFGRETIWK
jgi:glycosyltransferase involved in cell wall biosynthesis